MTRFLAGYSDFLALLADSRHPEALPDENLRNNLVRILVLFADRGPEALQLLYNLPDILR